MKKYVLTDGGSLRNDESCWVISGKDKVEINTPYYLFPVKEVLEAEKSGEVIIVCFPSIRDAVHFAQKMNMPLFSIKEFDELGK